jgi:hypothetical protein
MKLNAPNRLLFLGGVLALFSSSCAPAVQSSRSLPSTEELGNPAGGYRLFRVITHLHSPYSWDACDREGLSSDGTLNSTCSSHLREALCLNRIDFAFLSDHPDAMQEQEIEDLLLWKEGDVRTGSGAGDRNKLTDCENDFEPQVAAGFEDQLMALGMRSHLSTDITERTTLYQGESAELASRLKAEAGALVAIPHTESRSIDLMDTLNPDLIEVYNLHANISPQIRQQSLGLAPIEHLGGVLTYLLDPFGELNADFFLLHFYEWPQIYFQKWAGLIARGKRVTGIIGSDSHENTFPQRASDGERVDSHRRLLRWLSNHVLATEGTLESLQEALREGRSWIVAEVLGSPVGFDFTATRISDGAEVATGSALALASGGIELHVSRPALHADSPGSESASGDRLELSLWRVRADGTEERIARTQSGSLSYIAEAAGSYRAEVHVVPTHLKRYLGEFSALAEKSYPWIVTNPIHLEAAP